MSVRSGLVAVAVLLCALTAAGVHAREGASVAAKAQAAATADGAATGKPFRCANADPLRRPFFGDLHVHTALSQDASTQGTRTTPADAYRFARGGELGIQPFDEQGRPSRSVRLDRPLDFAAVTDHAEFLGELAICSTPGLPGHDSFLCMLQRNFPRAAFFILNTLGPSRGAPTRFDMCGEGARGCLDAAEGTWRMIRDAAEEAYDRTDACTFTTFVAYEWTASTNANNLHRNVIFRGNEVPSPPTSYYEAPRAELLHEALRRQCTDAGTGCDVLVIPHNSNLSGGLMFALEAGEERDPGRAAARAAMEPLVEIVQHKGASECLPGGLAADEECNFELLEYSNFAGKYLELLRDPPDRRGFARAALGSGLAIEERIGANPFQFGFIGSTDTHLGAPGLVAEKDYPGHGGAGAPAGEELPPGLVDLVEFGPGGLAAVWAEENSREAIFDALRRREAWATSGPRMVVRTFTGFDLPENLCTAGDFARKGYEHGVPMGGVLATPGGRAGRAKLRVAVSALADPAGEFGAGLDKVEIVKGWIEDGELREKVYPVATAADGPFRIDARACIVERAAAPALCGVWTDPDFDPEERAYYYARVLEQPTCRWSQLACNAAGVRCGEPHTITEGMDACCDPQHRPTVRERAWTSPVWYRPSTPGSRRH